MRRALIVPISTTQIPEESGVRRLPPRPIELRDATYDEKFDATTLFFDAFRVGETRIALIGPPLLNLESLVLSARFTAYPAGVAISIRYKKLDRNMQLWGEVPIGTTHVAIHSDLGRSTIPLATDCAHLFRGRRVVTTLSKNNELSWIVDWLRFHIRVHGCDAVLFYDNASDKYTTEELRSCIREITELSQSVIIHWPFRYGPQGNATGNWDSDFCQYGQLEHARWRLLRDAASVLNSDVDELVVTDSDESIFQRVEKMPTGFCAFFGLWVTQNRAGLPNAVADDPERFRHREFWLTLRPEVLQSNTKWCAVPAKCGDNMQWCVHQIPGKSSQAAIAADIFYRHFRAINTRWKWKRADAHELNPNSFFEDLRLKTLMRYAGI